MRHLPSTGEKENFKKLKKIIKKMKKYIKKKQMEHVQCRIDTPEMKTSIGNVTRRPFERPGANLIDMQV